MKQYSLELLNSMKIGNVCESIKSLKIREIFMSLKKSTMKNECGDVVCTISYVVWCDNNNAKCLAAIDLGIEWGK